MEDRKVVKLIRLLDKKERKKCEKWLLAELSAKNVLLKLYQLLTKILSRDEENPFAKFEEPKIWGKLISNRPYNDSRFRQMCSQLAALVEEFVAIEAFRRDKHGRNLSLIRELQLREANSLAESSMNKAQKELQNDSIRDQLYFRKKLLLDQEHLQIIYKLSGNIGAKQIKPLTNIIDQWILHEKMYNVHIAKNLGVKNDELSLLSKVIIEICEKLPLKERLPILNLYISLYLKLGEDPQKMLEVFTIFKKVKELLSRSNYLNIFILILNFYTRRVNTLGTKEEVSILLELYEWGVEDKTLFNQHYLIASHYKNIIKLCLRLRRIEKAQHYIESLKEFLNEKDREDAYLFMVGLLHFYSEKFGKAVQILGKLSLPLIEDELNRRNYVLQSFYELGERVELEGNLHALNEFIRSQKNISKYYQNTWYNQVKLFQRLLRVQNIKRLENLLRDIQTTKPLGNPEWLLEKTQQALEKIRHKF